MLEGLASGVPIADWPAPETDLEDRLFTAATLVFVQPAQAERARLALRVALGGQRFEYLMGLLAFIRTAHYWTMVHPTLAEEEDVRALLAMHEQLARLLLKDPDAERLEMGPLRFAELEELRGLNERRELEKANRALGTQLEQKENLLAEANHRVKNSLQIVSSLLHLQIPYARGAADALNSAASRVRAVAAVHERLYIGGNIKTVVLDTFLGNLCRDIGQTLGFRDGIEVELSAIEVPADMAVPLALITNELVANAVKYGRPPCRVVVQMDPPETLILRVADNGSGPADATASSPSYEGMGSRIVQSFVKQLGARLETVRLPNAFTVVLTVPLPASDKDHEGINR